MSKDYVARVVPDNTTLHVTLPGNVTVNTTSSGAAVVLTGLSATISSPGPHAVYLIWADISYLIGATGVSVVTELIAGTLQAGSPITSAVAGQWANASRCWRVTGLAVGNHSVAVRAYLTAATSVTAAATNSVLTVLRTQ